MGGLSTATIHLAIGLSKQFSLDQHQILVQNENSDDRLDQDYDIPNNLTIIRMPKFGLEIYPLTINMLKYIKDFNPDVLYLKGLWRQTSLAAYYWKRQNPQKLLICSPSGMLQPRCLNHKKLIKEISLNLLEKPLIKSSDAIHAVSKMEFDSLKDLNFIPPEVFFIPEGIPINNNKQSTKKRNNVKKLISVSRIDPIKGLDILIKSLYKLDFNGWECEIYGPGDESYINELKQLINKYKLSNKVRLNNSIYGGRKRELFEDASAFILPSFSEAFGIAIAEAMTFNLAIITTNATPWNVIKEKNLGWYVKPEIKYLSKAVQELFYISQEELDEMGKRAKQHILSESDWNNVAKRMKEQIILLSKNKKQHL